MDETWAKRDLPVLEDAVRFLDDCMGFEYPEATDIADRLNMDVDDVARAFNALDGEFMDVMKTLGSPGGWCVRSVTPAARRMVGQWPTAERVVDQLIGELERSAADEQDPSRKSKLHAAASTIRDLARDMAVDVVAKMINNSLGV